VGDAIGWVSAYDGGRFGERFDCVTGRKQQLAVVQTQGQIVRGGGYGSSKAGE
jgi:hypothetical protein